MPNKAKQLKSINCTQCSAPLELYAGGRRIESITCGYCGSVLDAKKEFSTIKKFTEAQRPYYLPLSIGQQGTIKGVQFTIIGAIEYEMTTEYSRWLEYFLYSPTHGYAWLEYENGHFVFSHKVRDFPTGGMKGVEKAPFHVRDRKYKVFDFYTAKITYVEGELTWKANVGDKVKLIDGISPPYSFTKERTDYGIEYSAGEYLQPAEVAKAFNIKEGFNEPKGVYASQPFIANNFIRGLVDAGKIFAPITLLLFFFVLFIGSGQRIFNESISANEYLSENGSFARNFIVTQPDRLVELELSASLNNAWTWFDIEILKDQKPIFSLSQQISYYHGVEGGESWSEGSRSISTYFKVPEAGEYSIRLIGEGGSGYRGTSPQRKSLHLQITEGVIASRYFLIMALIALLGWLSLPIYKYHFEALRWGDYEEDDE